MDWVRIHLATNHIPVIGVFIGLAVLAVSFLWNSSDLKRFSLYYFVALGLISILVFFTGEPAEEAIEGLSGVSEAAIETHEESSVFALVAVLVTAAFSAAGIFLSRQSRQLKPWFMPTLAFLVLITSGVMGWVASLGGKIRHSEIGQAGQAGTAGDSGEQLDAGEHLKEERRKL